MMNEPENTKDGTDPAPEAQPRVLTPAAKRALAEAEARRAAGEAELKAMPRELGGRKGRNPFVTAIGK